MKLSSLYPKDSCWLYHGVLLGYGFWVGLVCWSKVFTLRWVELGSVSRLVGWVGLKKLDPQTPLE